MHDDRWPTPADIPTITISTRRGPETYEVYQPDASYPAILDVRPTEGGTDYHFAIARAELDRIACEWWEARNP